MPVAAGARDRAADRRGARSGARARRRPSRSQAREHQDHARRARSRCSTSGSRRASSPPVAESDRRRRYTTEIGAVMGTAPYMSPEQGARLRRPVRRPTSGRSACVLYEMLTGVSPFARRRRQRRRSRACSRQQPDRRAAAAGHVRAARSTSCGAACRRIASAA